MVGVGDGAIVVVVAIAVGSFSVSWFRETALDMLSGFARESFSMSVMW